MAHSTHSTNSNQQLEELQLDYNQTKLIVKSLKQAKNHLDLAFSHNFDPNLEEVLDYVMDQIDVFEDDLEQMYIKIKAKGLTKF